MLSHTCMGFQYEYTHMGHPIIIIIIIISIIVEPQKIEYITISVTSYVILLQM